MTAYFDNSATTKPCDEALAAARFAVEECWGNPSSLHSRGIEAAALLKKARRQAAALIGCPDDRFFFTSSGTTANNTAIFGVCERLKKRGRRIVTTAIEHPSVLEPMKRLQTQGFDVVYLTPGKDGTVSAEAFREAVTPDTILVSCMAVNNEVGSVLPVAAVRDAIRDAGAPAVLHTDCVQALGKIDVSPRALGADIITVSGHKLHALKGVGGLYLANDSLLHPYVLGGGQEKGVYSGTEPTPAIASFGAAAEAARDVAGNAAKVAAYKARFLDAVRALPCVRVNSAESAIPYIVNLSVLGLPSQPLVNALSERGVCVSAGSACKAGRRSHVLTAMGLPPEVIDSAVRVSFSRLNTDGEVDALIAAFCEVAEKYGKK